MRRQKANGSTSETILNQTQSQTSKYTDMSQLDETMRSALYEELKSMLDEHGDTAGGYDFYLDMSALADYYDIDMPILEQFARNRLPYLGTLLDAIQKKQLGKELPDHEKLLIRRYVPAGDGPTEKKLRRQEMVQKYSTLGYQVNGYVIGAITAWKEAVDGSLQLGKTKAHALGTPMVETVASKFPEIPTVEPSPETLMPKEELAPIQQRVDEDLIRELATEYDFLLDGQRSEFLKYVFDCYPEATIEDVKALIPDFPDDAVHPNPRRNGVGM